MTVAAPLPARAAAVPAAAVSAGTRRWWLLGPGTDVVCIVLAPLVALALGLALGRTSLAGPTLLVGGQPISPLVLLGGIATAAHLPLVLVRSHLRGEVRRRHPVRFLVAPPLLLAALVASPALAAAATVVAVWWDVHHSCMQTFGIGRVYDRRAGNDPAVGRRLDLGLSLVLYAGPLLAGATFLEHLGAFRDLEAVGAAFLAGVPDRAGPLHEALRRWLPPAAAAYVVVYVAGWWRLARRGHRIAPAKIALFGSTAAASAWAWGLNPFGQAFFVVNLFHAVQYAALVWWSERDRLTARLRLGGGRAGRAVALAALLAVAVGYGVTAELQHDASLLLHRAFLAMSLLHFWYDGFVWSVRRGDVG